LFLEIISKSPNIIIALFGATLLLGWFGGRFSQKIKTPQVVGFIIIGLFLGGSFLKILPIKLLDKFVFVNYLALSLIGFDIGGELVLRNLKKVGKSIIWISILESVGAFLIVTLAIFLLTNKLYIALIFGALSSATAPAATVDVLREYRASGPLTTTLFAVVGIDDGIAIIIYAFASTFAKMLISRHGNFNPVLLAGRPLFEIAGALILGFAIGLLLISLSRRVYEREALLILGLGSILLCTGLATTFHFSLILTNMALGLTLSNLPRYGRSDIFETVHQVAPPIFILFFILVGARLQIKYLTVMGVLGIVYIITRTVGKSLGSYLGAKISKANPNVAKYLGLCLFSQAGVAIGLSIQTWHEFRAYGALGYALGLLTINVIAGTTLVFQLIGPPFTRFAILKAGEANREM